jgi:hypothetical protein
MRDLHQPRCLALATPKSTSVRCPLILADITPPLAVMTSVMTHQDRPKWAGPPVVGGAPAGVGGNGSGNGSGGASAAADNTNTAVVLPGGYCRTGPQPPLCWALAFASLDMALDSAPGEGSGVLAADASSAKPAVQVCLLRGHASGVGPMRSPAAPLPSPENRTCPT